MIAVDFEVFRHKFCIPTVPPGPLKQGLEGAKAQIIGAQ